MQYVGQTTQKFSSRLSGHRHNIKYNLMSKTPHVAPHFNQAGHDYSCTIVQRISHNNQARLDMAESLWIHRLNTVHPYGLNEYNP